MKKRESITFTVALLAIFAGCFSLVIGVFNGSFAWPGLLAVLVGAVVAFSVLRAHANPEKALEQHA
ncbi:hypothetical protein [Corynebacterium sp. MNWGS58]|uniref:hypothetical protein n=1 Tax=Corynebacterium sp. 102791.4 TaxID=3104612 RepID=UPI003510D7CB